MRPELEKLGLFYLGREVAADTGAEAPAYLLDSRDLTTHAVIVGMTGSGKTGLGIGLLEEAAIDGIPVIAIDPKGDVGNLLLTFPDLAPADFEPWISPDAARAAGQTPAAYAEAEARKWRDGLAAWEQDGSRITRLRAAADFGIYTPGSSAGRQLSVLNSMAPGSLQAADDETLTARASSAASSLLALAGIDSDPLTSRDHILLTTLFMDSWRKPSATGGGHPLASLIAGVSAPPFDRVGVVDLETFYPAKDRTALALRLNNLIASPSFAAWLGGEPMTASNLFYTADGRPRVSIVSISHLSDAERMFAVTSLLSEVLTWVRAQPGTSSLRAMLYFDEVFGFLPPVANPPSKGPMLTLLKQARASGLGVVLATQNPVDLDYKALSNTGTWFLGRLQTERDKARLLDGLESAGTAAAGADRGSLDRALSGLGKRRFLVHSVHAKAPVMIESRWALSYLRGPLTKEDVRRLTPQSTGAKAEDAARAQDTGFRADTSRPQSHEASSRGPKPIVAAQIPQLYLPGAPASGTYQPYLYGSAQLFFGDSKVAVDEARRVSVIVPLEAGARALDWDRTEEIDSAPADLGADAPREAGYAPLPAFASNPTSFAKLARDFDRWLGRTQRLELWRHAGLKMTSRPGESRRDFVIRVRDAMHEKRDAAVDRLRRKWETKIASARERVRRAEARVAAEKHDVQQSTLQTTVSFGATILGAVLGRKAGGLGTLGRATTAARGAGRTMRERQQAERAAETLEVERKALAELEARAEIDLRAAADAAAVEADAVETVAMRPRRGGTTVDLVAVVWR